MPIGPAPPRGSWPSGPRAEPLRLGSGLPRRRRSRGGQGCRRRARGAPHRLPAAAWGNGPGPRWVSRTAARGSGPRTRGREALRGTVGQPSLLAAAWSPGRAAPGVQLRAGLHPCSSRDPMRLTPGPLGCERPGTASGSCRTRLSRKPGHGPYPGTLPKPPLLSLCRRVTQDREPEPHEPSGTDPYTRHRAHLCTTHVRTWSPSAHVCVPPHHIHTCTHRHPYTHKHTQQYTITRTRVHDAQTCKPKHAHRCVPLHTCTRTALTSPVELRLLPLPPLLAAGWTPWPQLTQLWGPDKATKTGAGCPDPRTRLVTPCGCPAPHTCLLLL